MTPAPKPIPLIGESDGPDTAGVLGEGWTGANGTGVYGRDKSTGGGNGVIGYSDLGRGVWGHSNQTGTGVLGQGNAGPGVYGTSVTSDGVLGEGPVGVYGRNTSGNGNGVIGYSDTGRGVWGHSNQTGIGVLGESNAGPGVQGNSVTSDGVLGEGPVGVYGRDTSGKGNGVIGYSDTGRGVWGHSDKGGIGVLGESGIGTGVRGAGHTGGYFEGTVEGVHVVNQTGVAGYFDGHVTVTKNLTCLGDIFLPGAADCAEHFDVHAGVTIEPGSVVVIDDDGMLRQSGGAYDTKVAGVISGAGAYRPGIILDKQSSRTTRQPVALVGKVYCKADAQYAPIAVGDMLTSSPTPGHAMKAADPLRAFGAVIGKALDSLEAGTGLVRILVTLQ